MATRRELAEFSCDELMAHLSSVLTEEVSLELNIGRAKETGKTLLELDDDDLRKVVSLLGERKALKRVILSYKACTPSSSKQESSAVSTIS